MDDQDHAVTQTGPRCEAPPCNPGKDFPGLMHVLQHTFDIEKGYLPPASGANLCAEAPLSPDECVFTVTDVPFGYIPKKRGRKPRANSCSLCGLLFPYKCLLITHLQRDHKISRSKSLLYKRIIQGKKVIAQIKEALEQETEDAHTTP